MFFYHKNAVFSVKFCSGFSQMSINQATKRTENEKRNFRRAPLTGPL